MIVLSGADIVLPDRLLPGGTLVIDGGRIADLRSESGSSSGGFAFRGHTIVPGFIDVHVHGVAGVDTLDAGPAIAIIAEAMPRFGVTAFCPTTVACTPVDLARVLDQVRRCREVPPARAARVLPAHLESNFVSAEYRGAQPLECLRRWATSAEAATHARPEESGAFTGADVIALIEDRAPDIAIVTLAPEVAGVDLIARLVSRGIIVSLGHSAATLDEAVGAIEAGARHATHLFNRMPRLHHRRPGLAEAVLDAEEVAVEIICDGTHVHPALVRVAVAAKHTSRVMAITDGTAAAALPPGAKAKLGGRPVTPSPSGALLDDGTLAGSVLTMDEAFRRLTADMRFSPVEAAQMCATTPARQLGLIGHGTITEGAVADLVVLDGTGAVVQTYIAGRLVYSRLPAHGNSTEPLSV